ncbi:MAG: glycerophosphodiester phosphodiesterase family protein, partial [Bacteroidota bacterium]
QKQLKMLRRVVSILVGLVVMAACKTPRISSLPEDFDWQGHRGARGLLPENTVAAMLKALEYPVKTLELDVAITKDKQIVLSHEPWMSATICSKADQSEVQEAEAKTLKIYEMTLEEMQAFDCGRRGNKAFRKQVAQEAYKPTLSEVVKAAEARATSTPIYYNIEIKSQPAWDNIYTPEPVVFADLLLQEIDKLGIAERTCVQSFDPRALRAVQQQAPSITKALLVRNPRSVAHNLDTLGFTPDVYSPYHLLLSDLVVQEIHDRGMLAIPWTVNSIKRMRTLIRMGVDGIITDYPDRIRKVVK